MVIGPVPLHEDSASVLARENLFERSRNSYDSEDFSPKDCASYDSANAYNIFQHELRVQPKQEPTCPQPSDPDQSSSLRALIQQLQLKISDIHVRFEEDHYTLLPYSIGLQIAQFELVSGLDGTWNFSSFLGGDFTRSGEL